MVDSHKIESSSIQMSTCVCRQGRDIGLPQ